MDRFSCVAAQVLSYLRFCFSVNLWMVFGCYANDELKLKVHPKYPVSECTNGFGVLLQINPINDFKLVKVFYNICHWNNQKVPSQNPFDMTNINQFAELYAQYLRSWNYSLLLLFYFTMYIIVVVFMNCNWFVILFKHLLFSEMFNYFLLSTQFLST